MINFIVGVIVGFIGGMSLMALLWMAGKEDQ